MSPTELPLSWLAWIAALSPILILLVLLIWLRWSTSAAAPVALAAATAVAVFLLDTPLQTLAVATGKGVWDAIFILYVIWPSLILYNVANEAGAFDSVQKGMRALVPDRLLLVLAFGWVLSSFIQAIAGFGAPLAVTTPLLIGLGVRPVYAVAIPLIGPAWGNVFGSLGVPWLATLAVVDVEDPAAAVFNATLLLWIANLLAGLGIAWMYGRWWAMRRAAPAILVITVLHGGLQMALAPVLPALSNFIATAAALGSVFLLARWSFYRRLDRDEPDRIFTGKARTTTQLLAGEQAGEEADARAALALKQGRIGRGVLSGVIGKPAMSLPLAFSPYLILGALAVGTLMIPPLRDFLEQVSVGLPFPETVTGYAVERGAVESYSAFTPFTHPGTLLLLSAIAGFLIYRLKGLYPKRTSVALIVRRAAAAALPATTALIGLLLISKVMDHSGGITLLALGISNSLPPAVFLAATSLIGVLGTLITSSSTASNLLFAPLQSTTAAAAGLPQSLVLSAQVTGGAIGGGVAPGDILLGATIAGTPDKLGAILARGLPWVLTAAILVSLATLSLYWLGLGW